MHFGRVVEGEGRVGLQGHEHVVGVYCCGTRLIQRGQVAHSCGSVGGRSGSWGWGRGGCWGGGWGWSGSSGGAD